MGRDLLIDKFKGLAIILVVWGHCMQFCTKYDVMNNRLVEMIYIFHMPFFMAISGYLYYFSINRKSLKELVEARVKQLLIPFLIWSFLFLLVFRWEVSHSLVNWIKNYVYNLPFFFWFIWSLLICSFCTLIINKFLKDSLLAYILIFLFILLLPNGLGFYYTKFMVPYFFAGYLIHKHQLKTSNIIFFSSLIVFLVLWYFWKNDYYIYTSAMALKLNDLKGIYADCYRYLAGFTGIIVSVTLIKKLPDLKMFEILGRNTLPIYFISSFLNSYLYLLRLPYQQFLYSFVYTPIVTAIVIAFCIGISVLINKNKTVNQYLLGGR